MKFHKSLPVDICSFLPSWMKPIGHEVLTCQGITYVSKFNPYHKPAGQSDGGQFDNAPGGDSYDGDDHIDSDLVGGLVIPAIASTVALEVAGIDGLVSLASRVRSAVNSVEEIESTSNISEVGSIEDLNALQNENLTRFESKLPMNANSTRIINLSDGGKVFQADVPARNIPNSYARYEKIVDTNGNTIQYTKTTYAPDGKIVHVKIK